MRIFFRNLLFFSLPLLTACGVNKSAFSPAKKYAPEELQHDYTVYETILKANHPGLYWYTSKDSMDFYFAKGREQLNDSLTEPQFRKVLAYVTAKINCGHTTVRSSKAWNKYSDTARLGKMFPLSMKIWDGGMVVTANLNRRDSILKRGTEILSINGKTKETLADTMFQYISTDGYNRTHKFQSLSNRGFLGSVYTMLYGIADKYTVEYKDSLGSVHTTVIPPYNPAADTALRRGTRTFRTATQPLSKKQIREQQLNSVRLLRIDSANKTAMMDLASFAKGYGLKKFFKNSFRVLKENKINHLIIDLRSNGGGSVNNSTLITRYLINNKFKLADSLYAVKGKSPYQQYIKSNFWNNFFFFFFTKKKKEGMRHFGYYERHYFNPKSKNHFKGKVYILTGGNSFSASTLFALALIKQDNVTVIGEETGGGAYGNSAWLIPDVTLPVTGVRFRLPLFRLVIDKTAPKTGRGVQPEIFALPTVELIRKNADFKVEKAMELISADKKSEK
jgi:hypothetical protein